MKTKSCLFLIIACLFLAQAKAQNSDNWTSKDLMAPAVLAEKIKTGKDVPMIFSVGPGAVIPGSIAVGMASREDKLEKFKKTLADLPKNTAIVVYCGCCPFGHCPNVRPAIEALRQMKFTNFKLLDLPLNIRQDWISPGYPTIKE